MLSCTTVPSTVQFAVTIPVQRSSAMSCLSAIFSSALLVLGVGIFSAIALDSSVLPEGNSTASVSNSVLVDMTGRWNFADRSPKEYLKC